MDTDFPINVIILEDIEQENESLIDAYYDILKTCKKASEVKSALKMMCAEQYELTLRSILIKDIQNKARILEETKKQ